MIESCPPRPLRFGRVLIGLMLILTVGCAGKTLQYKDDHDRILRIDQAVESLRKSYVERDRSALEALLLPSGNLDQVQRDIHSDFDTFRERGVARLPVPDDAVAFARQIRDPERYPFTTPSGKIEIYSLALAAEPDPYGLGAIPPLPTWIPDAEEAAHPLRLVSPKSRARTHSIHDNQPLLARADRDDMWIHPLDAGARGIADGQSVRVFNGRGATVLPARVTDRIAPGVVAIKEGAWFALDARGEDTRGCSNVLTPDVASPAGASPFNTCFVEVAPA